MAAGLVELRYRAAPQQPIERSAQADDDAGPSTSQANDAAPQEEELMFDASAITSGFSGC